jgi:diaminohydroxyphosphoribosylaminopyrimidine deaminase/5-amino-6-(5-phosphoribosylamino)uracil reductase
VRLNETNHQPYRVILDTHLSINLHAKILKQQKIILAYGDDPDGKLDTLHKINIHCLQLPIYKNFIDLNRLIRELTNLECNDILVESGPTLNGHLLKQNLIDELILYMAPIIMGGEANPIFNNPVLNSMQEKIKLKQKDARYFGGDLRLIMKVLQD